MPSLVSNFLANIVAGIKPVAELLREAKVIAAQLELPAVEEWMEHELKGYIGRVKIPDYRYVHGTFAAFNPYNGWISAGGDAVPPVPWPEGIALVEAAVKRPYVDIRPPNHVNLTDYEGNYDHITNSFEQRLRISSSAFHHIVERVRNELLDWALVLKKNNIKGDAFDFNASEKTAAIQNINIGTLNGVLGNVMNSSLDIFDYSRIYQTLKDVGVPQSARNEIENILDDLKRGVKADEASLIEKGRNWFSTWGSTVGEAGGQLKRFFKL